MNTGATLHLILMIFLSPLAFGAMAAVVVWFFTQKSDAAQANRVTDIWNRRQEWGEPLCRQLIDRQIAAQMTPAMVKLAWGEPVAINRAAASTEEWRYPTGSVTFENGLVAAFTGAPAPPQRNATVWVYIGLLLGLAVIVSIITLIVVFIIR